ncbi:hypothetical protein ISG33_12345 [Glaciecola sp. MH2013]|uniref:hypothetical protein n=1 Tax=Glaciecola sp. MH2013 TaxID=2785524 RepID=UPI00189F841C|nr:hypothetical protein [Glaciecola sp. MH2013]MBF7074191.1 hypothetical protein [Glaciecola sp. MH2013]
MADKRELNFKKLIALALIFSVLIIMLYLAYTGQNIKTPDDAYRDAIALDTVAAYQGFLDKHPSSIWAETIAYERDNLIYAELQTTPDLENIVSFLNENPRSRWAPNFRELLRTYFYINHESEATPEYILAINKRIADMSFKNNQASQVTTKSNVAINEYIADTESFENKRVHRGSNVRDEHFTSYVRDITPYLEQLSDKDSVSSKASFLTISDALPEVGFRAYYYNRKSKINYIEVHSELVDNIALQYAYDDLKDIPSEDFAGYWVGQIHCEQDQQKLISIAQSRAQSRVIIDGEIFYEGGISRELLYFCEKGSHKIEVDHFNNWHTTDFFMRISDPVDKIEKTALADILEQLKQPEQPTAEIGLVSVYESAAMNAEIRLDLDKSKEPLVLFLNSYNPVRWIISNVHANNIEAIVYQSFQPGTHVIGDISKSTRIIPLNYGLKINASSGSAKCICHSGYFYCEGGGLLSTLETVKEFTKRPLHGVTIQHEAEQLAYPQRRVTPNFYAEKRYELEKIARQQEVCKQENEPNFDAMFNGVRKSESVTE